jgi:hypothetical protein
MHNFIKWTTLRDLSQMVRRGLCTKCADALNFALRWPIVDRRVVGRSTGLVSDWREGVGGDAEKTL